MKRCIKCGEAKSLTNFHKDSYKDDGYQIYCKPCRLTLVKGWRLGKSIINKPLTNLNRPVRSNREYILNDKITRGKCIECGYDKHLSALHYHHVDSSTKKFVLSDVTAKYSIKEVQDELDKCILLCANCHAITHLKENRPKKVDSSQEDFIRFLMGHD